VYLYAIHCTVIKGFRHDGMQRLFRHGSKAAGSPTELEVNFMTRMHNPPHPGAVLQDTVLRADGGITVTEFAKRLRVSRVALSRVVNGHAAISAELAIRLAAALGGSAESWLRMQITYDLWHAAKKRRPKIVKIEDKHLEQPRAA
jgi:addiction module HigA family antidote